MILAGPMSLILEQAIAITVSKMAISSPRSPNGCEHALGLLGLDIAIFDTVIAIACSSMRDMGPASIIHSGGNEKRRIYDASTRRPLHKPFPNRTLFPWAV